jgi:AraC-like DNA-binding protein
MGITSMDDKFLQKAKEVADKNLSNSDYTIEDFASAMALSRSQLHRKLKALINSSGTEFINTIKMNYAIELLQKKAGTISEIAYDAGFNNPNYFSKIFRRKFGMSPSEYQNNIG